MLEFSYRMWHIPQQSMKRSHTSGFTLVEIMVVVVIVGLLTALAIPALARARESSQNARLASDLRMYGGLVETFSLQTGVYPEDSSSGAIPSGMGGLIKSGLWNKGPSIGGVWDVEKDSYGIVSAIGVHQFTVASTQLVKFDQKCDDGNVTTGKFRLLTSDRYYYVVAE